MMDGVVNSLTPLVASVGENAALGSESRCEVCVTQFDCPPDFAVAQPAGKLGAVTPSKFSKNVPTPYVPGGWLTTTVMKLVSLMGGRPLSVTTVVMTFVLAD